MLNEEMRNAIRNISEQDVKTEIEKLGNNWETTKKDLTAITDKLSEEDIKKGVEKYGGMDEFIQAILLFIAFKALLVKRGFQLTAAATAGAAICFGTGYLGHSIASATGLASVNDIANIFDSFGDTAVDVAGVGVDIADNGLDFFEGALTFALTLVGLG